MVEPPVVEPRRHITPPPKKDPLRIFQIQVKKKEKKFAARTVIRINDLPRQRVYTFAIISYNYFKGINLLYNCTNVLNRVLFNWIKTSENPLKNEPYSLFPFFTKYSSI